MCLFALDCACGGCADEVFAEVQRWDRPSFICSRHPPDVPCYRRHIFMERPEGPGVSRLLTNYSDVERECGVCAVLRCCGFCALWPDWRWVVVVAGLALAASRREAVSCGEPSANSSRSSSRKAPRLNRIIPRRRKRGPLTKVTCFCETSHCGHRGAWLAASIDLGPIRLDEGEDRIRV